MRRTRITAFLVGATLGAAIWILSLPITGQEEPWDAHGFYYPLALLVAGLAGGWIFRGRWAVIALGIFVGQATVLMARVAADPSSGGLWPLGLIFMAGYSVLAIVGALIGTAVTESE